MSNNVFISVIAPTFNEAANIKVYLERTETILKQLGRSYEIIIIDDGSHDNTVARVKDYAKQNSHIRLIAFSRNYGHEIALTAGIEHAAGEYVIQMDSDLQHPPELIPQLIDKASEGYDVVYAARADRKYEPWLKQIASKLFYRIARSMTGFEIPDDATNYRIISHKVVASFRSLRESNRHVLMIYAYLGYKTSSIPFTIQPRFAGKSKYSYLKLLNLAIDSIISFSHWPLRYMSALSVLISLIMASYAGFIVLQKLFSHGHLADGMASVIFIMSGLFAILFLFLAIISEYIGRILVESKNRPLYYIKEDFRSEDK
jgi:polyisoprenyl-phosphate glycosyltransferase